MAWQPTRPAVRIVTMREDGSVASTSGLSLEEAGQRMTSEESIFPRMFLSMEAERLIRSFNCDAVYSQPVRIARPVHPPPPAGGGRGMDIGMRDTGGGEVDPLADLNEIWERDQKEWAGKGGRAGSESPFPLTETQSSSTTAWKFSPASENISTQLRESYLQSPLIL